MEVLQRHLVFELCMTILWCWIPHHIHAGQAMLFWSSERNKHGTCGIYSASAFPKWQLFHRNYLFGSRVVALRLPHLIYSFDSNDAKQELTIMDVGRGNVAVLSTRSRQILRSHRGITNAAQAIAVDWKSGNTYWSDEKKGWIMASTADLKNFRIVVKNDAKPRGLALYPQKGYMFWSQLPGARNATIMRATLSGEEQTILSTSSKNPAAIALDYVTDRLYWIDTFNNAIYCTTIHGETFEKVVFQNTSLSLKDLHVYREWLYVTVENRNLILLLNKTSGKILHKMHTPSPYAISVVGGDAQPIHPGPCDIDNGGCEQFCFAQPPGNRRTCGCSVGMVLGEDGTTCISIIMSKDFFLVVDSDMKWIFQVSSDGHNFTKLSLPGVSMPVQLDFDPSAGKVYWTDVDKGTVNSAYLNGTDHIILAQENVRQPTGVAVDRYSKNVYWTDEGTGTINVIKEDGTHRKTLLSKQLSLPRGLVIDPNTGYMWWSDWGRRTIERAAMDGTGRKVIADRGLAWTNSLALDFNEKRLYWSDAKRKAIESIALDGKDRSVIVRTNRQSHIFGLTLTEGYIYWTDWHQSTVMRLSKEEPSKKTEKFGPEIFDKATDIHGFFGYSEEHVRTSSHPCQIDNGNCVGLCIPIPENTSSLEIANRMDDLGKLVSKVCVCGNEHNGSCEETQQKVNDSTPPSFGTTCPTSLIFVAPQCQELALVNYTIPTASDDSGHVTLQLPTNPPPLNLTEGEYQHRYVATDQAGNRDICNVRIIVKVIRCGTVNDLLDDSMVDVVATSCGTLFGSRVRVRCITDFTLSNIQYVECEQDGKWSGAINCPKDSSTTSSMDLLSSTVTSQSSTFPSTHVLANTMPETTKTDSNDKEMSSASSASPTIQYQTSTQEKHTTRKLPPHLSAAQSTFPYGVVIAILVAILIISFGAILYKYYRSNSMPLLAALEKTVKYRHDDNADAFTLDDDTVKGERGHKLKGSGLSTQSGMKPQRRSSLPVGRENPACEPEAESGTLPKLSNYGTLA